MMEPHRAVRDCQSYPESAGVSLSRVVCPVEGPEDILQFILREAGSAITYIQGDRRRTNLFFATELELDYRLLPSVTNSVANDVLDGTVDQFRASLNHAVAMVQ